MSAVKSIVGQRFGMLVVQTLYDTNKGYARWICTCDCGAETIALGTHLRQGNTRSCGCLQKQTAREGKLIHGELGTPTYIAWQNMIRRCASGTTYQKKGITVCEEWLKSYQAFVADMGHKPDLTYSLERNKPTGNYNKANCQWIPKSENTIDTYRGKLTKRGAAKTKLYENS